MMDNEGIQDREFVAITLSFEYPEDEASYKGEAEVQAENSQGGADAGLRESREQQIAVTNVLSKEQAVEKNLNLGEEGNDASHGYSATQRMVAEELKHVMESPEETNTNAIEETEEVIDSVQVAKECTKISIYPEIKDSNTKQPRRDSEGADSSVPPPPQLTLQRRVNASLPGAYSVVPEEQSRFRDIAFRRNHGQRNDGENAVSHIADTEQAVAASETRVTAPNDFLVSATLVASAEPTADLAIAPSGHDSTTCVVQASPAMDTDKFVWDSLKRNRKVQAILCLVLLIIVGLTAALVAVLAEFPSEEAELAALQALTVPSTLSPSVTPSDAPSWSLSPTITDSPSEQRSEDESDEA